MKKDAFTNHAIKWTQDTWNPVVGCLKKSYGCNSCYAITMAYRQKFMNKNPKYDNITTKTEGGKLNFTGEIYFDEKALLIPLKKKKPTVFFVCSMADLFYEGISFEMIDRVFAVMALCPQHTFQVLTKRPERMMAYFESRQTIGYVNSIHNLLTEVHPEKSFDDRFSIAEEIDKLEFLPNVWLGTSVESQKYANERIPYLLATPAKVRFLSCEPLLEGINLQKICTSTEKGDYIDALAGVKYTEALGVGKGAFIVQPIDKINWIITGGESGHKSRPMHPDWVRVIRDQCATTGTYFFHKQNGAYEACNDSRAEEVNGVNYCLSQFDRKLMVGLGFTIEESCFLKFASDSGDFILCYETGIETPKIMLKTGKSRTLDGVEYDDMPER